jgi:hypothetical protein
MRLDAQVGNHSRALWKLWINKGVWLLELTDILQGHTAVLFAVK